MTRQPTRGTTPGLPTNTGSFKATEKPGSGVALTEQAGDDRFTNLRFGQTQVDDLTGGTHTTITGDDGITYRLSGNPNRADGFWSLWRHEGDRLINVTPEGGIQSRDAALAHLNDMCDMEWPEGGPDALPNTVLDAPEDEDPLVEARAEAAAEEHYANDPFWGEPIHVYTRSEAIADGVLIDHSKMAAEAGITWPVVVTAAVQADAITWDDRNAGMQDETGRAWDLIWMASATMRRRAAAGQHDIRPGDRIPFTVHRVPNTRRATQPRPQRYDLAFTLDDDAKPCWTIMKPDES